MLNDSLKEEHMTKVTSIEDLSPRYTKNELAQMAGANSAPTVVGSFGKAVTGAVSLNYSEGADVNCDDSCPLKEKGCYTVSNQKRKPAIRISGERKRKLGFATVVAAQYWELKHRIEGGELIPWARVSSFGATPNRVLTGVEKFHFGMLIGLLVEHSIPVHIPVETEFKRKQLEEALRGLEATVRLSTHGDISQPGSKSTTAGTMKMKPAQRLIEAERMRKEFKGTAVVCPAIRSTFRKTKAIKCGACNACANPKIELIIYPMHG
jgi:hypothetical protein